MIYQFSLKSLKCYFKIKILLILNSLFFCFYLIDLFFIRNSFYESRLENPLNPEFIQSIVFDIEIYYKLIILILPINLFVFQVLEAQNAISDRLNFYPIKRSGFFYQRLLNLYILAASFTFLYLVVFGIKIGQYMDWKELPINHLIAILKKLLMILVVSLPYLSILTLLSFYIKNFFVGIGLHLSLMYLADSHDFFFLPSSWGWITSFYYRSLGDTFQKELPFVTLSILGMLCLVSIILWVEKRFKQNNHE